MNDLHIRWMINRDMPAVMEIERQSFEEPWSQAEFLDMLKHRNVIPLVAEIDNEVVGYLMYELERDHIAIIGIATMPYRREEGIGTAMVAKVRGKLGPTRDRLAVMVREGNLPAQLFFSRRGFRCIKIVRDPYETGEDGYHFIVFGNTKPELVSTTSRMARFFGGTSA